MRFTVPIALSSAILLTVVAGLSMASPPPSFPAATAASIRFLFDLGDGTYYWASETIPDPSATNATWDAVQDAAARLGLHVSWSWFSCCGVFIQDIGNRSPPSGSVGLFLWNATTHVWDSALVGVSSLVLLPRDAVALSNNAFDPVTYATLAPIPTPEHPTPAIEFRGNSANTGVSTSSAPNGVDIGWDRDLGVQEIPSSPAVAYGRIYILTLDGLFALDESSGAVLWTNSRIRGLSTPAVFNGTLILGGSDGKVHSIHAATGQEIWNTTLVANPFFSGLTSSPKILFSRAYVGTFNESGGPGEVVAMWATNGTVVWRQPAPGSVSFSSPAVVDGRLFVGIMGRYNTTSQVTYNPPYGVLALNATSGSQIWFHATNDSVAASAAVSGRDVYVPSKDGRVYALDAVNGSVRWTASVQAGVSSPSVWNGTLYVAGGAFGGPGRVTALDVRTGLPKWTFAPNGPVQSSVTYADGKIFFSTNAANGTVYALDAAGGRLAWAFTPTPAQYILGSPIVADGMAFAPSDNGHVYAIQAPRSTLSMSASIPSTLSPGQNATMVVTISSVAGLASRVNLSMVLLAFQEISAQPNYSWVENDYYYWSLGDIPFAEQRVVSVHVRAPCVADAVGGCREIRITGGVNVQSFDLTGHANPDATEYFQVTISTPTPPTLLPWWLVAIPLVVVAVGALVILALVWNRKRWGRGP